MPSRQEAIAQSLPRYTSRKPCRKCGGVERYISGSCVPCDHEYWRDRRRQRAAERDQRKAEHDRQAAEPRAAKVAERERAKAERERAKAERQFERERRAAERERAKAERDRAARARDEQQRATRVRRAAELAEAQRARDADMPASKLGRTLKRLAIGRRQARLCGQGRFDDAERAAIAEAIGAGRVTRCAPGESTAPIATMILDLDADELK